MANRCRRCGGTYTKSGDPKSLTGIGTTSCMMCGHDPNTTRRAPSRTERRPATHNRATLTRYQERSLERLNGERNG